MDLDYGTPHLGGRPRYRFDAKKIAEQYVDKGMSLRQIGKIYNVSAPTVRNWLHKAGVSTKKPVPASK